jgi:hypothetical protein
MTGGSWRVTVGVKARGRKQSPGGLAFAPLSVGRGLVHALAFGTGAGDFTLVVARLRSLGAGLSETLDLYGGTDLPDVYDDPAPFRLLSALLLWVDGGGDAAGVTVGNAAVSPHPLFFGGASHTQTVEPGGLPLSGSRAAGVAVTGTARNVKVTNNGAALVNYVICLAGSPVSGGMAMGPLGLTYP